MQKIKFKIPIKVNTHKLKELALPLEQALGRVLDYVAGLAPRERLIVIGGAVFVSLFILLAGIIGPLMHYKSNLEKSFVSKDAQLRKIYTMSAVIRGLQAKSIPAPPWGANSSPCSATWKNSPPSSRSMTGSST